MTAPESDEADVLARELRDVSRLAFFGDAAVAISLTLLFVPVSDFVKEQSAKDWTTLLIDNPEIVQSAISFVMVATCWRYHHVLYERLRDYTRGMVWLNFFWLFCVVSIPVLTLAVLPPDKNDYEDYRNFFSTIFVKGVDQVSHQNYFVLWAVTSLSFLALYLISRRAAIVETGLAKAGTDVGSERWVYLRPLLVCAVTAIAGLIHPRIGYLVLLVGTVVAIVLARRSATSRTAP